MFILVANLEHAVQTHPSNDRSTLRIGELQVYAQSLLEEAQRVSLVEEIQSLRIILIGEVSR